MTFRPSGQRPLPAAYALPAGCTALLGVGALRVVLRDLDEHQAYPVRVFDPHLDQPPRFPPRCAQHRHARRTQPDVLGRHITDLDPDRHARSRRRGGPPGDFEESLTEEEHQAGIVGRPELAVDRQPEGVLVEPAAAVRVSWAEQDAAAEHFHAAILPGVGGAPWASHGAAWQIRPRNVGATAVAGATDPLVAEPKRQRQSPKNGRL